MKRRRDESLPERIDRVMAGDPFAARDELLDAPRRALAEIGPEGVSEAMREGWVVIETAAKQSPPDDMEYLVKKVREVVNGHIRTARRLGDPRILAALAYNLYVSRPLVRRCAT